MSKVPQPIVALVGRPNVGKSTLFNRLVGRRRAIVEDTPGTTRDRLYGECEWRGILFLVVDTGGLEPQASRGTAEAAPLARDSAAYLTEMRSQAELAMEEADCIIFLVDVAEGLTSADQDVADLLRRSQKPVILAANKCDNEARRQAAAEFYALGMGTVWPISALHGTGTGDLLDEVVSHLPARAEAETPEEEEDRVAIAIVGRPNVGKSSLLNALLGAERAIVSPVPGTTRDAIDSYLEWEGTPILLIDTAGIRRRGKVQPGVEQYSVLRALMAIRRADVVLLMIDATEGVTTQDAHVAEAILDEFKSVVVLVNKWDLVAKDAHTLAEHTNEVRSKLRFLDYVPVLFISALTRKRVDQVIPLALQVYQERKVRVPTGELNRIVREATARHAPPSKSGKRLRIYYATQTSVAPPTFVFFVSDARLVHFSYERFLENQIRAAYPFVGTPLRMLFRTRERKEGAR